MFDFDVISLDHDIENSNETFDTVAIFINEKYKDVNRENKPNIILHTANPAGAQRMINILDGFNIEIIERGFN